jgi:phage-related protein
MRPVVWIGSSKKDLIAFPADARRQAGFQLDKVQRGEEPDDWKPMRSIGFRVREIRINEASGAFRVIYVAERGGQVYALHCFQKKGQKTSQHDLTLARQRFRSIGDKL